MSVLNNRILKSNFYRFIKIVKKKYIDILFKRILEI